METERLMTRSSAASSATPYERRKPSFTFRHDFFLFLAPPSCPSEIRLVYRCEGPTLLFLPVLYPCPCSHLSALSKQGSWVWIKAKSIIHIRWWLSIPTDIRMFDINMKCGR
jgi:hypothetical protein